MQDSAPSLPSRIRDMSLTARRALLAVVVYLVFLVIALAAISPEQYDIHAGDVSPATITAGRDIVDEITTEKRRQAASAAVSSVYYKDETVSDAVLADLDTAFSELRAVRELGAQIRATWSADTTSYQEADYQQAASLLETMTLSTYQLRTLMNTSESDFESLYQGLLSATRTALVSNINQGQVEDAISNIQQIVAYNTRTDLWYNVGIPVLRRFLRPNMLIDQEATEQNRQKAAEAVEPTIYKQGQNIVVKGDRVSAEQLAVMEALGLIRGEKFDFTLYIAAALIVAVILSIMALFAFLFDRTILASFKTLIVVAIACFVSVVGSVMAGSAGTVTLMPLALAAMLTVNLIGTSAAYLANLFVSLFMAFLAFQGTSIQTEQMLAVLLVGMTGGTAAILFMRKNPTRLNVLFSGILVGAVSFAVLTCVGALTSAERLRTLMANASAAFGGGLIASVLCLALQPILESAFNLVTPAKLIELSNPNQPLLRRLMIETPGTYHHSMIVANLAEAAADEVGANALLVRVGAYYHDIGKLVRPQYFKENQVGENPHDKTEPRMSAAILTEHTRDGVELARRHHLPEPIIDLIEQHHGDTPVMYFYAKAIEQQGKENVDIADYRYDGPKPQTEEAAILMLADTVEAAVRSIQEPTREKISTMIRKLVRGKMEDGQLDECTLTFRDIGKICAAFETVLQGVFHERIEYPDISGKRPRNRNPRNKKPQRQEAGK